MPRCDLDGVLYRIFCITLLSIAVFSTVVLINVVVDIDGVLNTNKVKTTKANEVNNEDNDLQAVFIQDNSKNDDVKEIFNYDDENDDYRTKRSLDIPSYLNKKFLTNRLATLLEELDEEEIENIKTTEEPKAPDVKVAEEKNIINKSIDTIEQKKNDEDLHSAVHKLILEETATHDLIKDVYQEIHDVVGGLQATKHHIGPRVIINTVIDILPAQDKIYAENNLKDFFKLIYKETANDSSKMPFSKREDATKNDTKYQNDWQHDIPILMNKILKQYYNKEKEEISKENMKLKRKKRNINVKYKTDEKTTKNTNKKSNNKDEELFVEIETHFDSKGLKGEKKKKLVRDLIDKIEKAIHNETLQSAEKKKKKHKHLHVKKRNQNPLDHKNNAVMINKLAVPYQAITHRKIDPISKASPLSEPLPFVDGISGENWGLKYTHPKFLSPSKSINSAELSQVDTDYNRILEINGIPQRLQKPINTEASEEMTNFDLGKLKFFVKDIADSGFSVGFSQYEDTAPDAETMKMFTGLENILQNYHQNYDLDNQSPNNFEDLIPGSNTPNLEHTISKRSIDQDYHSNEYRLIFDTNYMPYNDYKDILGEKADSNKLSQDNKQTLFIDQNVFEKDLKPSEILSLAELFRKRRSLNNYATMKNIRIKRIRNRFHGREKRSFKLKKITNLKNKIRLNRYLNTKVMSKKKIFITKKRNKRQIGTIRIVASDSDHGHIHSDEDIFVVSGEKLFADRAIVRDMGNVHQATTSVPSVVPMPQELFESDKDMNYDYNIPPYVYEQPEYQSVYSKSVRNNALMSKYPHIFLEEIGRSKDYELPYGLVKFSDNIETDRSTTLPQINHAVVNTTSQSEEIPSKVNDMINAIAPKSNYKLTVKILPKNSTDINSGYKEIHTIINNSYNKDGLQYSSVVNVSEISKVIKLNKTTEKSRFENTSQSPVLKKMIEARNKIKHLLEKHKERINSQLHHLNQEKEKLELLLNNDTNIEETAQNFVYNLPVQKKFQQESDIINVKNTIYTTETTQLTTEAEHNVEITTELDKQKLVKSIERNENLTSEILKKIDKNTDLLQTFLKRVLNNIERTKPENKPAEKEFNRHVTEFNTDAIFQHNISNPKDLNPVEFFSKTVPNLEMIKNNTHVSIPFVYAYQKSNKHDEPSSVVYHGHIHTNTIPGKKEKVKARDVKIIDNVKRDVNQTKFFIDDLENDFKIIALNKKRTIPNDGLNALTGRNINGTK